MSNWNPFDPGFWGAPRVSEGAVEIRSTGAAAGVRAGVHAVQVNDASREVARRDVVQVATRSAVRD